MTASCIYTCVCEGDCALAGEMQESENMVGRLCSASGVYVEVGTLPMFFKGFSTFVYIIYDFFLFYSCIHYFTKDRGKIVGRP